MGLGPPAREEPEQRERQFAVTVSLLATTASVGYLILFLLIAGESAGLPLPGETSLVAAAVLAAHGHLSLPLVIAVAAAGAIAGDNAGYLIGRRGGRWLLTRPGRFAPRRERLLERGERFFARHGAKAVFLGRWLPGLRITAAWLAGVHSMEWRRFLAWNALGGIAWSTSVGIAAYFLGAHASRFIRELGFVGAALLAVAAIGLFLLHRRRHRQHSASAPPAATGDAKAALATRRQGEGTLGRRTPGGEDAGRGRLISTPVQEGRTARRRAASRDPPPSPAPPQLAQTRSRRP